MYLISGCLLGRNCKYNGGNNYNQAVTDFCRGRNICEVCPEEAGGLPVPRPPAEYQGEHIVDKEGRGVTEAFERGAEISLQKALKMSKDLGEEIEGAILKANSPSCGSICIYDGTFSGTLIEGRGCFAGKLLDRGIKVFSEKEINDGKF